MSASDDVAAKLISTQLAAVRGELAEISEHAAHLRGELAHLRREIVEARGRLARPYDANEWWQSLSLIQELTDLVGRLQPIVRERGAV